MKITAATATLAIFGDPVSHSISPVMQGAALEATGLDMVYLAFRVAPPDLGRAVDAIGALGIRGVNITIPHKERVMDFLDEIDETARALGAVNTIENRNGRLCGHNTDAEGFVSSLVDETGIELRGRTALVVGAGGAARAVVYGLASRGAARILVANRTTARAEALCADLAEACPGVELKAVSLDTEEMKRLLGQSTILVNATSLGMKGRGELDLPLEHLGKDAVVSDIVYTPMETGLLRRARALGLGVHHGLGMLVGQGALSFEIWTGRKAPVDVMREAALRALGQGPG
jgi:shikimate dehydrogenase